MPNSGIPGLKQFRHEGCISYLFFDARSGDGVLVDPRADLLEEYREFITERRIKPLLVVDTQLHWHHLSGSHLFAETYRVPVAMSACTRSERAARRLEHGEKIRVGEWELTVLSTPGVSPDAICLQGPGLLLSGDTIIPAAGARIDLPGGDAASLWGSLQEILSRLPGQTAVLPGYDSQELLFSTLDVEKKLSPDWRPSTREALIRAKAEEKVPRGDGNVRERLEYNRSARPAPSPESHFGGSPAGAGVAREARGVASISVEKCALKLKGASPDLCFLDVREAAEFRVSHVPGALNIPLSELALHLPKIASFKRVYVSCGGGSRGGLAARTLDYVGLPDVVHVSGGLRAWENAGLPVDKET